MGEVLSNFGGEELLAVLMVSATLASGVIVILGFIWRSVRRAEITAELKRDLVDRGMPAEDIRTVLEAGAVRCAGMSPNGRVRSLPLRPPLAAAT